MFVSLREYLRDECGATLAEFGLISSLVVASVIAAFGDLPTSLDQLGTSVERLIEDADAVIAEAVG